ncbi:MAG: ORF6N domain-containing protein [Crocinitomicaceae bacterium]|nr:ORF6N domain-containing protein [Crocinitomicaceae bacterium]
MEINTAESRLTDELVINKIYFIRGQKVMIDADLAELYDVPTKRLNEQLTRNLDRFPEDFAFRLNQNEYDNLKSQIATSSWGGKRKLPYAFTELGIAMLSSVLNSKKAIQVNIAIMRIFVSFRQTNKEIQEIKSMLQAISRETNGNTKSIELLFEYMDEVMQTKEEIISKPPRKQIGFKVPK